MVPVWCSVIKSCWSAGTIYKSLGTIYKRPIRGWWWSYCNCRAKPFKVKSAGRPGSISLVGGLEGGGLFGRLGLWCVGWCVAGCAVLCSAQHGTIINTVVGWSFRLSGTPVCEDPPTSTVNTNCKTQPVDGTGGSWISNNNNFNDSTMTRQQQLKLNEQFTIWQKQCGHGTGLTLNLDQKTKACLPNTTMREPTLHRNWEGVCKHHINHPGVVQCNTGKQEPCGCDLHLTINSSSDVMQHLGSQDRVGSNRVLIESQSNHSK